MGDLLKLKLGDICQFKAGDAFKKDMQGRSFGNYPFVKVSDMNLAGNEIFITRAGNWVSESDVTERRFTAHQPGSIVFAKIGIALTYNRRRILRLPTIIDNNMMAATPDAKKVNERYFYYLLRTLDFNEISLGSALPYLTQKDLAEIDVALHPLPEQESIDATLSALDDKIELNRRMNETLEAMARALFKDWFVDFGPTRAKIEGRDPYLAPETWDLFPDKLDEDGKPEGWEYGRLADIADSPSRGVRPSEVSKDTPYIGLEHMPRRSVALTEWEGAGKVTSNKYVFKRGEFLFGKLRPYFHKVGIAPIDGICSTDIVVIAPRAPHWNSLTLACISTDDFVDYTNTTSTGTKMPRTSWKTMGQYELCFSTVQVAQAFEGSIGLLTTRIVSNIRECKALSQSRDLLLPKLMSGEIRVGDTDKIVLEST